MDLGLKDKVVIVTGGGAGIGGAITDSTAEVYATLAPEKRAEFMRAYYDREAGIGYSLARTTIHSSDFSSASFCPISGPKTVSSDGLLPDGRRHRAGSEVMQT